MGKESRRLDERRKDSMAGILVVRSRVKQAIKEKGCYTSTKAIKALSKLIEETITKAAERAKANRRRTVKASDI